MKNSMVIFIYSFFLSMEASFLGQICLKKSKLFVKVDIWNLY